jgi:ABC-type bacteriocin/lantibiotic exporter with double-glycine peptidase domain
LLFMTLAWSVALCSPTQAAHNALESPFPGCGPGSVYALLRLQGWDGSIEEVEFAFKESGLPLGPQSVHSLADLRRVLARFGVSATAVESSGARAALARLPAILHLDPLCRPCRPDDQGHWVVLHTVEGNKARIIDVTRTGGGYVQPIEQLRKRWKGAALVPVAEGVLRSEIHNQTWAGALLCTQLGILTVLAIRTVAAFRAQHSVRGLTFE